MVDWERDALQQGKVNVDIEPLSLVAGEAAGDGLKGSDGPHRDGPILSADRSHLKRCPVGRSLLH